MELEKPFHLRGQIMKKKKTLAILLSMTYLFAASFCLMSVNGFDNLSLKIKATDRPSQFDCSYYFNPANEFTSIYDINCGVLDNSLDSEKTYKTWGTVTAQWLSGNEEPYKTNTYIQSRSSDGHDAAILLYNCNTPEASYPIGSVIEVTFTKSKVSDYNGMIEISNCASGVERAYGANPNDVIAYDMPASDWQYRTAYTSETFRRYREYGPRKIHISGATVVNLDDSNVTLKYGTYFAYGYFGGLSFASSIKAKFQQYLGLEVPVDLTAYMGFYISGGNRKMQLLIRDVNNIEENYLGVKSIEVDTTGLKLVYHESDSELEYPTNITAYYTDGTNHQLNATELTRVECTGYDFSVYGYQVVVVTYTDENGYRAFDSYTINVFSDEGYFGFTYDNLISSIVSNKYQTGSSGSFNYYNVYHEFYRAVGYQENSFLKLLPFSHDYGNAPGGAFLNRDDLYNIKEIHLDYHTESADGNDEAHLYYGQSSYSNSVALNNSTTSTTLDLTGLDDVGYFKVETGDCALYIDSLYVIFNPQVGHAFTEQDVSVGSYRTHTQVCNEPLVAGSTTAEAVTSYTISGGEYVVKTTKEYTYYTYEYVSEHPECVDDASMITPEDVSNYYSIFKQFPANYVYENDWDAAYAIFGSKTRCVSTYNRTDGYMNGLPWKAYPDTVKPRYHEFDIDLDGTYSKSNRSVGRLVAVESGFTNIGYGNGDDIICFFTDDHYSTFQEYNNLGEFLPRFNRNNRITNYRWSEPTLLTKASA